MSDLPPEYHRLRAYPVTGRCVRPTDTPERASRRDTDPYLVFFDVPSPNGETEDVDHCLRVVFEAPEAHTLTFSPMDLETFLPQLLTTHNGIAASVPGESLHISDEEATTHAGQIPLFTDFTVIGGREAATIQLTQSPTAGSVAEFTPGQTADLTAFCDSVLNLGAEQVADSEEAHLVLPDGTAIDIPTQGAPYQVEYSIVP